jgi:hypothetical protein
MLLRNEDILFFSRGDESFCGNVSLDPKEKYSPNFPRKWVKLAMIFWGGLRIVKEKAQLTSALRPRSWIKETADWLGSPPQSFKG